MPKKMGRNHSQGCQLGEGLAKLLSWCRTQKIKLKLDQFVIISNRKVMLS